MFVAHKVNISKLRVEKCQECGFETLGKGLMNKHMVVHRESNPVQCDICNKMYPRATALAEHKRRCHSGSIHVCSSCSFSSRDKSKLAKHIAQVHEEKRFNCSMCNYKTFTETRFRNHQRSTHGIVRDEANQALISIMEEYPGARLETRCVPSASNKNTFSTQPVMTNALL